MAENSRKQLYQSWPTAPRDIYAPMVHLLAPGALCRLGAYDARLRHALNRGGCGA